MFTYDDMWAAWIISFEMTGLLKKETFFHLNCGQDFIYILTMNKFKGGENRRDVLKV